MRIVGATDAADFGAMTGGVSLFGAVSRDPTTFNSVACRRVFTGIANMKNGFTRARLTRVDIPLAAQVIDRLAHAISASSSTDAVPAIFTAIQASITRRITSHAAANHITGTWRLVITCFAEQAAVGAIHTHSTLDITALILSTVTVCSTSNAPALFGADTPRSALSVVLTL